jgi:hypothetical protein
MNLFFYLQTFILNYSFIVILSDHIFCICFIKTQPFVKRKKNTGTIAFHFRQVLLYNIYYLSMVTVVRWTHLNITSVRTLPVMFVSSFWNGKGSKVATNSSLLACSIWLGFLGKHTFPVSIQFQRGHSMHQIQGHQMITLPASFFRKKFDYPIKLEVWINYLNIVIWIPV